MRVLLDTVCWLWLHAAPERFRPGSLEVVETTEHELLLSAASSWEIAIKVALGKLTLPEPPPSYVPRRLQEAGVRPLPVHHVHALRVAELPAHHRDPFDRLLIAQAQVEGLTILTADAAFRAYDVDVLDA